MHNATPLKTHGTMCIATAQRKMPWHDAQCCQMPTKQRMQMLQHAKWQWQRQFKATTA